MVFVVGGNNSNTNGHSFLHSRGERAVWTRVQQDPWLFKGRPRDSDHLGEVPHPSGGGNAFGSSEHRWETVLVRERWPQPPLPEGDGCWMSVFKESLSSIKAPLKKTLTRRNTVTVSQDGVQDSHACVWEVCFLAVVCESFWISCPLPERSSSTTVHASICVCGELSSCSASHRLFMKCCWWWRLLGLQRGEFAVFSCSPHFI